MNSPPQLNASMLLRFATGMEGGLAALALFLGWLFNIDPLATLRPNLMAILAGLVGTVPLLMLLWLGFRYPWRGFQTIRKFLEERLGPPLAQCSLAQLFYLGMLAGVCEELLFRGFLQVWLERDWGLWGGLLFSNLMFALVHWVTPLYGLLAGLTGLYLGLSMDLLNERNLVTPVLVHGMYDFLAFMAVVAGYRARPAA